MTRALLPEDFDWQVAMAVQQFWLGREGAPPDTADREVSRTRTRSQGGNRDAVIGGKHLDGFIELVRRVTVHAGLPAESVHTNRGAAVLPGYFRPYKSWDAVVVFRRRLLAVFEFKSHVGPSFGNNFNNRTEEAVGSAADLWVAHQRGAFRVDGSGAEQLPLVPQAPAAEAGTWASDPRPPFVAWLMLLEEVAGSTRSVGVSEPHFSVFPEFRGASYAERYRLFCERLIERGLYGGAALLLSQADEGARVGRSRALSEATSVRSLFTEFAARCAAAAELAGNVTS